MSVCLGCGHHIDADREMTREQQSDSCNCKCHGTLSTCVHCMGAGCFRCCEACNYDRHICPGCGDYIRHTQTACADCQRLVPKSREAAHTPAPVETVARRRRTNG